MSRLRSEPRATPSASADVRIELLGRFRITLGDREILETDWPTRRALELVALLALDDRRRLPRDRVIEQLWPHLGADAGAANLRKAAHHARRTLGDPGAVELRGGEVELFPRRAVASDVGRFLRAAEQALARGDLAACATVADTWPGDLLPSVPYEPWAEDARRRVRAQLAELLRRSARWERLMELEPTDESACRELMRAALAAGRRHVAIGWYERLRIALAHDLGVRPGEETRLLYDRCTQGVRLDERAFVGRERELATIAGELQRAAAGGIASAVLVRGATGIGKSALCREVVQRADEAGWRTVVVASASSGAPYAPIASAIEQLLIGARGRLADLPARTRAILAALSPAAGPQPDVRGTVTRHQVVAGVRRALALQAMSAPTLLCVEDAHLLDEATADVLHQLVTGFGAGVGAGALVALLPCRAEWIRTSLARGLTTLARSERALTVELGPLDDATVGRLVASAAPSPPAPEAVAGVVQAAAGSPFFALELARTLGGRSPRTLPRTLREAIEERFAHLGPDTMAPLAKLAVAGDELDLATVLALSGLPEDDAFRMLDAAVDAGVLVVAGTRYRFRHELVRQALDDDLPPHRRIALHRSAARRLVEAGAVPTLIARHWLRGGRPDEALPWLMRAARRAIAVGAYTDALRETQQLLAEAPSHREGLCLHAEVLDALGDSRAPDAYAAAAVAVGEPEAQELRARQALAQLKASDPAGALRTLHGVVPRSTAGRLAEALTLSAAAAVGAYGDADTAAAKAQEAYRLAVALGDPGAILDATWAQALAAHAKGELPARLREYLHATHALPELATRVFDGQLCVTERMLYGGLPNDEIVAFADGLADEARRIGAARGHAFALTLRGEAQLLAGRLAEADRDFAAGARLHGGIGAVAGEALSLLGRAQVATQRGRGAQARPFLADALLMARESEVGHHTLDRIYGAMVAAARGPAEGVAAVREAETAIVGPAETCPTCRIAFVVPAAIAAARAGDVERAGRYRDDCERAIASIALPPAWHAAVDEVRGWLAGASGDRDVARLRFGDAADGFAAWGQPLDADRCAALAGR